MTRLLSRKKVALTLDVSERTIMRWIEEGKFPRPVSLPNGQMRWQSIIVEGWMAGLRELSPVVGGEDVK